MRCDGGAWRPCSCNPNDTETTEPHIDKDVSDTNDTGGEDTLPKDSETTETDTDEDVSDTNDAGSKDTHSDSETDTSDKGTEPGTNDTGSETETQDTVSGQVDDLLKGLVAWYPLDGDAKDYSGNENHGVAINAKWSADRFGNSNQAFDVEVGSYIDCGNSPSVQLEGAFTIAVWIRHDTYSDGNKGIVAKYYNYGDLLDQRSYALMIGNAYDCSDQQSMGVPVMTISSNGQCPAHGGPRCNMTCGDTVLKGLQWYHLAAVYTPGDSVSLYVDGLLVEHNQDEIISSLYNSAANLVIGYTFVPDSESTWFVGRIDDIRIYNRALGASEISEIYNLDP